MMTRNKAVLIAAWPMILNIALATADAQDSRRLVAALVSSVQRADYQGDRARLKKLRDDLRAFVEDGAISSRVLYWRGFALWRSALNGFNDSSDWTDIEADLNQAVAGFRAAVARDPRFVDAKAGEASCLANLAFLHRDNRASARELLLKSAELLDQGLAIAPDNPRLLWVQGANQWYSPAERGGGQQIALATYEKGLRFARQQKGHVKDPLEPAWGEPELLMNLAFANLNRSIPDIAAAERYAKNALKLIPYWHYVRDILMAQIRKQKDKSR